VKKTVSVSKSRNRSFVKTAMAVVVAGLAGSALADGRIDLGSEDALARATAEVPAAAVADVLGDEHATAAGAVVDVHSRAA